MQVCAYAADDVSGAVYVYANSPGYTLLSKLQAPDRQPTDSFGRRIVVYQDMIIAGAFGRDNQKGIAYVFKSDGTLLHTLTAPDGKPGDWFGRRVSMNSNYFAVTAMGADQCLGATYVYTSSGKFIAKLAPLDGKPRGYGTSVDMSEDLMIVGALGTVGRPGSPLAWRPTKRLMDTPTASAPTVRCTSINCRPLRL